MTVRSAGKSASKAPRVTSSSRHLKVTDTWSEILVHNRLSLQMTPLLQRAQTVKASLTLHAWARVPERGGDEAVLWHVRQALK